jgi:hypothetical protein
MAYSYAYTPTIRMYNHSVSSAVFSLTNVESKDFKAANENLQLMSDWMTPAEALQTILRIKQKIALENRKTYILFHSAARRKVWDEINACEQCLRWMYFRSNNAQH